MTPRAKPGLAFALVVILALGWVLFRNASRPSLPPAPTATVLFLGFTNLSGGTPHAILTITNGSPHETLCIPGDFEELEGTRWMRSSNAVSRNQWIGYFGRPLLPSRTSTFLVPALTHARPWRIRFQCAEYRGGLDRIVDRIRDLPSFGRETTRRFRGRHYELITPELVTPQTPPSASDAAQPTPSP